MPELFPLIRPALHAMDAETAHRLTLRALKAGLGPRPVLEDDARLHVALWDKNFPNPVGLAAGFDKNAEVIGPMLAIGFGFVEAGSVTPRPQEGNPRPRVFRDAKAQAVINRMGMPNQGLTAFKHNLERFLERRPRPPGILGINIGMNKGQTEPEKDYCQLVRALGPYADYLTLNISSPNTPGLRNLQERGNLLPLLAAILDEREKSCGKKDPPVLVKISPDLSEEQLKDIAQSILESGVDGVILTNTTVARPETLPENFRKETGGLSGRPLTNKSTEMISAFYRLTEGKIPVVGLGGVSSGADAYAKIRAGASLVQLYSALVFQGPGLVRAIRDDLLALIKRDGFDKITQAIGADHA